MPFEPEMIFLPAGFQADSGANPRISAEIARQRPLVRPGVSSTYTPRFRSCSESGGICFVPATVDRFENALLTAAGRRVCPMRKRVFHLFPALKESD